MARALVMFSLLFYSKFLFAAQVAINLSQNDQAFLAKVMSTIDTKYRREEINQTGPYPIVSKYYEFLDGSYAFGIGCLQQFHFASTVAQNSQCFTHFNPDMSVEDVLVVHDGFTPELVVAQIKDSALAQILYKTIGQGRYSPKVFFNTTEVVSFSHPVTGQLVKAFRMRIDCERDASYSKFSCLISAVK